MDAPGLFQGLLGGDVTVKAADRIVIEGRLVHVDRSQGHNGGFGNLILEAAAGPVLVKGASVVAVLKKA